MRNNKLPKQPAKIDVIKLSVYLILILVFGSWMFVFTSDHANLFDLFSHKNLQYTQKFLGGLAGIDEENPAFLSRESWINTLRFSIETLQMSIMAIGFATIIMVLTVIPAARNVANGSLTLSRKWYGKIMYGLIRGCYIFSRSVPELIWAMIIIFIIKPGILPGAIALALHNFGILGKLCAEVIEDVDIRPIRSLASSGASKSQIFIYGVIPTVLPQFITYILYRWEVIIRTTIVVGFVGAGGLGQAFKLSMSWFHYSDITLFLICYILLVVIADTVSEGMRKIIK